VQVHFQVICEKSEAASGSGEGVRKAEKRKGENETTGRLAWM